MTSTKASLTIRFVALVSDSITLTIFQNLESSDTSLLVFGNGDGGGGPLAKMLENVSRGVFSGRSLIFIRGLLH